METVNQEENIKSYSLTVDEPHLSSTRNGVEISYKAGDQIIVNTSRPLISGCLVLVTIEGEHRLCRYEKIYGNEFLFPPISGDPSCYREIIVGPVVDHVRISKWLTIEE